MIQLLLLRANAFYVTTEENWDRTNSLLLYLSFCYCLCKLLCLCLLDLNVLKEVTDKATVQRLSSI